MIPRMATVWYVGIFYVEVRHSTTLEDATVIVISWGRCRLTSGTWGFPRIRGTLFGGPHKKDCSILGSILGYPKP